MVSRAVVVVATLGGCNWVFGLNPPGDETDAAAADAIDAVDAIVLDAPLGRWGPRQVIPGLDLPMDAEEDPFLDVAETELYTTVRTATSTTGADVRVSLWFTVAPMLAMPNSDIYEAFR